MGCLLTKTRRYEETMNKIVLIALVTLIGSNCGSSIADRKPDASTSATGGSTGTAGGGTGGTAGAASGGATGTSMGGTTSGGRGGTDGTATGGSIGTSTGGHSGGTGGVLATGGSRGGDAGGTGSPDAAVDAVAKSDGNMTDVRWLDVGGTGGATGTGGSSATGGTTGTGGATGTGAGGTTTACVPAASGGPSGMNSGKPCITCHGSGQSPAMKIAGTLYSALTGGSGVSGATVTITPASGSPITMVTGQSGNFYSNSAVTFPATVQISKCPNTVTMPSTITSGDCNSCHGSSQHIHLP